MTGLNEALNEAAAIIKASIGRMMNEEEKLLSWEWRSVKGAGNTEFPFLSLALSLVLFFLLTRSRKGHSQNGVSDTKLSRCLNSLQ